MKKRKKKKVPKQKEKEKEREKKKTRQIKFSENKAVGRGGGRQPGNYSLRHEPLSLFAADLLLPWLR